MSVPGKVSRTSRLSAPNTSAGSVGLSPGKRALTDSLSAPKLAAPEPDGVAEVVDALDGAACVDGKNAAGEDCSMSPEKRGLLMAWITVRAGEAGKRWLDAINTSRTQTLLENPSTVPLWVELLADVALAVLPAAIAKGGEILAKLAPKVVDGVEEIAKSKDLVAAMLGVTGPLKGRALAATASAETNPKTALLSALKAVPGQWVDQLYKDALAMDDSARSLLCAVLDPDVLTVDKFDAAVADVVQRFTDQVTAIGPDRRGGVHAAYLMNAQGVMRMAVVSFDRQRSERFYGNETHVTGDNRYRFERWIDDDMGAAAMSKQVQNTAPPVLRIDDPEAPLANPNAPELEEWRESTRPKFQPQYIDTTTAAVSP